MPIEFEVADEEFSPLVVENRHKAMMGKLDRIAENGSAAAAPDLAPVIAQIRELTRSRDAQLAALLERNLAALTELSKKDMTGTAPDMTPLVAELAKGMERIVAKMQGEAKAETAKPKSFKVIRDIKGLIEKVVPEY